MTAFLDKNDIPEGIDNKLFSVNLLNISNMNFTRGDKSRGDVIMNVESLFTDIKAIQWCKENSCYPIKFDIKRESNKDLERGLDFIRAYVKGDSEKRLREKLISDINQLMSNFDLDNFYEISPEVRWELEPIKAAIEMGTLNTLSMNELKESYKVLKKQVINFVSGAKLPEPIRESDYITDL